MMQRAAIVNQNNCLMISGDLNFVTVVELQQQSLPLLAESRELNFDFTQVTSVNSAGLALLVEWLKYARHAQKSISFINLPSELRSIAGVAGMGDLLNNS